MTTTKILSQERVLLQATTQSLTWTMKNKETWTNIIQAEMRFVISKKKKMISAKSFMKQATYQSRQMKLHLLKNQQETKDYLQDIELRCEIN